VTAVPVLETSPVLLIGDDRSPEGSGGTYEHVYAGTGEVNATVPLAGSSPRS
jgi:hypothetical protein